MLFGRACPRCWPVEVIIAFRVSNVTDLPLPNPSQLGVFSTCLYYFTFAKRINIGDRHLRGEKHAAPEPVPFVTSPRR